MKPSLVSFLADAAREMRDSFSVQRFIHLRYHVFNSLFPHPIFGVSQCKAEFFEETLSYVTGGKMPDPEKDEYLRVYLNWCKENRV